jgi:hypothetical protein
MSLRYSCCLFLLAGCVVAEDSSSTAVPVESDDDAIQGAPALTVEPTGLHGYITSGLSAPPNGFKYGFSTFARIYTLNPSLAAGTQLGWGTWVTPNNDNFNQPLCPVGTLARDHWPERGPSYRDVYQTMEGGPGQWASGAFPSVAAKFRINSTPDCYNTEVASTGWTFYQQALPPEKLGLVQLSNRLLTAPDGFTFSGTTQSASLGYGYLALPIIPARPASGGKPAVGNQSWTLFLKAANFGGPVAFFAPEMWTQVNATDQTGAGRGMDAQPMTTGGLAVEIGNTPMFTATAQGKRYRRIPRITFPADATTRSATLHQQVRYYAKNALWNAVQNWMDNGVVATQIDAAGAATPTITSPDIGVSFGDEPADVSDMVSSTITSTPGGSGWGIHWKPAASKLGALPEYYVETSSGWKAVPASAVPAETGLTAQTFPKATENPAPALDRSAASPWTSAKASAGPFTVNLVDGSTVKYVWYRFVDQPAIARLGLSSAQRAKLQKFAESLHAHSGLNGVTLAAPPSGGLASLDAAQLVTPPVGLEKGYVPVVVSQR